MSDKNEKAAKPISQHILDMATVIKKGVTVNAKEKTYERQDGIYESTLPADLDVKTIQRVRKHDSDFAAASTLALGELTIPAMKKNKDLDRMDFAIPMTGRDKLEVTVKREVETPVRTPGKEADGSTKVSYGVTRTAFNFTGLGKSGDMGRIREKLANDALEAYGS